MEKTYKAAMVVIGNEILSGRTQDKNINYLANKLVERGISLAEVRIVPDIEGKIIQALHDLKDQLDYVFTSGGIGPTHDDITSECVARACGAEYEIHDEAYKILEAHYGQKEFNKPRQKMAMTPKGATLIPNPVSAAPGFIIENIYVMAGVPRIMQAMVDHVVPSLAGGAVINSQTVHCNYPESKIAESLGRIQERWPEVDIGSYPAYKEGKPSVNVVLRSASDKILEKVKIEVETLLKGLDAEN